MTPNPFIGSRINNYEILERIGQGGMGDVYLARHPQIGKKVAIKLLKPEYSENQEIAQRFFHEAKVVNEIHHQNVVDVLDFGQTPEGECYIIMEYLEGESLSSLIVGEGPLSREMIGHIGLQICAALAAAHSKGVIHRDLKSDNIFLIDRDSTEDFVKLFDFGIAKFIDKTGPLLTTDGMTMGTPTYMSPEQAMGRSINEQTDVYALGVLLYYMATKTYPFFDTNPIVVATMQIAAPLPLPSERYPEIDRGLESVIVHCLEKDQALRYASMQEVAAMLGRVCRLDVAAYFGKKRGTNSQEFRVSPPLTIAPKKPSRKLLITTRRSTLLGAALLLGLVGVGLLIPFSGQTSNIAAHAKAEVPTTKPTLNAAPFSAPAQTTPATSPSTTKAASPKKSPQTPKKAVAEPKKPKITDAFKKFQWNLPNR